MRSIDWSQQSGKLKIGMHGEKVFSQILRTLAIL
jgi:hypothetical protein